MKKLLLITFLAVSYFLASAQTYDLIVKNTGDSIACKIDSLDQSSIYFQMKFSKTWIQTSLNRSQVRFYEYKAVHRDTLTFRAGTTYILPYDASDFSNFRKYSISFNLGGSTVIAGVLFETLISPRASLEIGLGAGLGTSIGGGLEFYPKEIEGRKAIFHTGISTTFILQGWGGKLIYVPFGISHFGKEGKTIFGIDVGPAVTAVTYGTLLPYASMKFGFRF